MLAMQDFHAAKILVDFNVVEGPTIRDLLLQYSASKNHSQGFLKLCLARQLITDEQFKQAQQYIQKQTFMRAETVYLALLKKKQLVSEEWIEKARQHQAQGQFQQNLGGLLVTAGQLSKQQDQYLRRAAIESIDRSAKPKLDRHIQDQFSSLLAKSSSAEISNPALSPSVADAGQPKALRKPTHALTESQFRAPMPMGDDELKTIIMTVEEMERRRAEKKRKQEEAKSKQAPSKPQAVFNPSAAPVPDAPPPPPPIAELPEGFSRSVEEKAAEMERGMRMADGGLGETFGDFRILRELGKGGNGIVYLAERDGQQQALKVTLKGQGGGEALGRFKREILATSFFDHANVIQIFDAGDFNGDTFMAMEFLDGQELDKVIASEGGRIPPRRALKLAQQILSGLAAAHRAHIVHRDLKPQNFMVLERDGKDFIKIMDFGVARILNQPEEISGKIFTTMKGKVSGSPKYMAPEVITDPKFDTRADLYSFGVVLFEMLTGKLPLHASTPMKYLQEHLYSTPKTLEEACPDVEFPESLQRFLTKLMEKKPEQRYQKAEEALAFIKGMVMPDLADTTSGKSKKKKKGRKAKASGEAKPGCLAGLLAKFGGSKKDAAAAEAD